MHWGQVFKVFLQAVRDRSLFESEVRWEREKNMLLPLATGLAEETASPEKSTAMGSPFTALQLAVSLKTLSPNPRIFPGVSHYLSSLHGLVCGLQHSKPIPKHFPLLELSSPVALYQLKCSCKTESGDKCSRKGRSISILLCRAVAVDIQTATMKFPHSVENSLGFGSKLNGALYTALALALHRSEVWPRLTRSARLPVAVHA